MLQWPEIQQNIMDEFSISKPFLYSKTAKDSVVHEFSAFRSACVSTYIFAGQIRSLLSLANSNCLKYAAVVIKFEVVSDLPSKNKINKEFAIKDLDDVPN